MKPPVLIAGAGLAGLACARELHARGRAGLVLERENAPGGLCRSVTRGGFTFDYTGHFLHFQNPATRRWVMGLPGLFLKERRRHAAVYSRGTYTEYPYQENNAGLDPEIVHDNVLGYLEATLLARFHGKVPDPTSDFPTFCKRAFGDGITRNFMEPYNAKLWKRPLKSLTALWMGRFVPKPQVREVVEGALHKKPSDAGYNASFLYPRAGGIQALPLALLKGLPASRLRLGTALRELDVRTRTAYLSDGTKIRYDHLVSTLALPRLAAVTRHLPTRLKRLAGRLKSTSVFNMNFGLREDAHVPYSWVYFPEPEFPFHRAGCLSSCVKESAPRGGSSLYVEVSYNEAKVDMGYLGWKVLESLVKLGWIRGIKDVAVRVDLDLPGAYVVYDRIREEAVPELLDFYAKRGVLSVGRWGRWEYGSMEDALEQGREAAKSLV